MIKVTKIIEWDMGHRVPNHKSKCRNPHGHRYRLELTLSGELVSTAGKSDEGMVFDFGDIKQAMVEHVHDIVDHGFMIYEGDEQMTAFFESQSDSDFKCLVVPFIPTAENIAAWCYDQLKDAFPQGVDIVNCRIFETPNSWADFQPGAAQ